MTTFDPQPQSRRAVRQSERAESRQNPFAPSFDSGSGDMWDTTARRAAQLSASAPEAPAGRRAAPQPAEAQPEPLTYSTQNRSPFVPQAPVEPALPPTQALPRQDAPQYRVRDFSPEGRRAATPPVQPAPPAERPWSLSAPASDLDYHTEARIAAAPPAPTPVPAPPAPVEHTMTRRELRAMQQAEQAAAMDAQSAASAAAAPIVAPAAPVAAPEPIAAGPIAEPEPLGAAPVFPAAPVIEPPASDTPTVFPFGLGALAAEPEPLVEPPRRAAVRVPEQPSAPHQPSEQPIAPEQFAAPAHPSAQEPPREAAEPSLFASPDERGASPLPPVAPAPLETSGLAAAINEFDSLSATRAVPLEVPAERPQTPPAPQPETAERQLPPAAQPEREPGVWTPPTGHWSTQLDEDHDPFENTLSRSVRSGQTATNALVLPSMPLDTDIRGPLTVTGEVMLTGSIDLPRSLAATGSHDAIESEGIDALFDANDHEINSTDSSPVRAIRAVSTHNSGHGVTHTQKPKGGKVVTGLIIGAAGLAVVVAGLLVAAISFNLFGS